MSRIPACHPDRKMYCKGLCRSCYDRAAYAANVEQERQKKRDYCEANRARYRVVKRAWFEANREKSRASGERWRRANPDKVREIGRAWYESNAERRAATAKGWRSAHPEKVTEYSRRGNIRRRASCVAYTPRPATPAELAALVAPGVACFYCETAQAAHVDHFIPLARWGTAPLSGQQRADGPDHISNLVGACAACNLSKHDRLPDVEWRGRRVPA